MIILVGRVLGNRYEILEEIGQGGMAYVYKARCRILNRIVAVKILRKEFLNNQEFLDKFKNEAQSAASLTHPNIVNIYDVGQDHEDHYIVMEYIDGISLKDLIKREGKLSESMALDISKQIAQAISQAHKNNIIHRDIKPHNILITKDCLIKVVDFGIAKAVSSSTVTNAGGVIGSVHYFSPEQARGGYLDEKSDLYSLGIVLYEMLVGNVPFRGDSPVNIALKHINEEIKFPPQMQEDISDEIQNLIFKLTRKNQTRRYSSAEEVIRDIEMIENNIKPNFSKDEYENYKTQKLGDLGKEIQKHNDMLIYSDEEPKEEFGEEEIMRRGQKKKSNKKIVLAGISLGLICSILLFTGFMLVKGQLMKKQYLLPDLTNMQFEKAKVELESKNITLEIKEEKNSDDVEKGNIIDQEPQAETKIKEGTTVYVSVSKGGKLIRVPDFTGESYDDIEDLLDKNKLALGDVRYKESSEDEGIILSQDPIDGSRVEADSEISFVVSEGKQKKSKVMPNLIGKTKDQASSILPKGIKIGRITFKEDKNKSDGTILYQGIPSGTSVEENDSVDLIINKLKNPSVDSGQNQNTNNSNAPIVYQKLSITLPDGKDTANVVIKEKQGDSSRTIYNKNVNVTENQGLLTVSIGGKEGDTKEYQIFVDNQLYHKMDLKFTGGN